MDKIIKIKEDSGNIKEVAVKSTAACLLHYKSNFGKDGLVEIMEMEKAAEDPTKLNVDAFMRFFWVFAYSANKEIPPLEEWLESFNVGPVGFIEQVTEPVIELIASNIQSASKKKSTTDPTKGKATK